MIGYGNKRFKNMVDDKINGELRMKPIKTTTLVLVTVLSLFFGGLFGAQYVYSQTGAQNSASDWGLEVTNLNATHYYLSDVLIDSRLGGDFAGLPLTGTTLDTGQGAYELYGMDQDVFTTSDVEFSSVNFTGPLPFAFNGTAIEPDALLYPVTEASYIIWSDGLTPSTYYAKNGTDGSVTSGVNVVTLTQAINDAGGRSIVYCLR